MKHAVVAVIRRDDRVLIIERGPAARRSGYWGPLTGTVEPGETQEQALVREVREEVALEVRPGRKVWECPTDDGSYALHWWTAEWRAGVLTIDRAEVSAARWLTPAEFLALDRTFEGDREFFRDVWPALGPGPTRPPRPASRGG